MPFLNQESAAPATEAHYRHIFEASGDGLLIIDPQGRVGEANAAAHRMLGYDDGALIGLDATNMVDRDSQARLLDVLQAAANQAQQLTAQRQDGSSLPIELRVTRLPEQPHQRLAIMRDIRAQLDEYHTLEERLGQRNRELATLLEVSHSLASTLELQSLIGLILDRLKLVVDYSAAAIFILESAERLRLLKYQGPIPQERIDPHAPLDEAGHSREIIRTKQPLIIRDIRADTPMARAFRRTITLDVGAVPDYVSSWMGVPLIHRNNVLGILAVHHSELGFYTPHHAELALAFANNAAVAIENARLFKQAQELAALIERQRLARELHDSVSQSLYGIALGARTARKLLDIDPARIAEPLDYVSSLAEAGMAEMRALIFELRPESLELEGLVAALSKQAAALRARYGLQVRAELCDEPQLAFEIKETLYRIGQEALHNIVKHARARQVELRLSQADDAITLDVRDDGVGFEPGGSFPGHLGLRSMHERIARLHGSIRVNSAPGLGTHIAARIPLPNS
jgi:PAS domain S-box-containing protein